MIATFLGFACCAFGIPLFIASGMEMRRYHYNEAVYDYNDPWIWWVVSIILILIGGGFLFF